MLALAVLKKGLPRIRGVLVSTSMSRTTKSTGDSHRNVLRYPRRVADRLIH
jgi:hypothetical protein